MENLVFHVFLRNISFSHKTLRTSLYGNASLRSEAQNHIYVRVTSGPMEVDLRLLVVGGLFLAPTSYIDKIWA